MRVTSTAEQHWLSKIFTILTMSASEGKMHHCDPESSAPLPAAISAMKTRDLQPLKKLAKASASCSKEVRIHALFVPSELVILPTRSSYI